ncbi:hypothetical protein [Streptomyces sp. NPDC047315]|uniref:hypothetical protein n=1 Tax=Streptomyces sp. NPDC047315 TaxID=3155142 RepID=UPI0033F48E2D
MITTDPAKIAENASLRMRRINTELRRSLSGAINPLGDQVADYEVLTMFQDEIAHMTRTYDRMSKATLTMPKPVKAAKPKRRRRAPLTPNTPSAMARPSRRRPSSAGALYRALDELGVAPTPDPKLRPNGPKRSDTALLLGILLAKAELGAAVRADPSEEPPHGLTQLMTGYRSAVSSRNDETHLRHLSLRLLHTAVEATLDDNPSTLCYAADDAALAAALIDADRLQRTGNNRTAVRASINTATQSLYAAINTLSNNPGKSNTHLRPGHHLHSAPHAP